MRSNEALLNAKGTEAIGMLKLLTYKIQVESNIGTVYSKKLANISTKNNSKIVEI